MSVPTQHEIKSVGNLRFSYKSVGKSVGFLKKREKFMADISIAYITAAIGSLIMLVVYSIFIKKKYTWFWVLFASICVVNVGYFVLSISTTLGEALLANRIAYLGSVFLPMSMLLIILNATKLQHPKWLWIPLVCIGVAVFFVAASPGYSDIYYKSATLTTVNGVSVLEKEYGPWHKLYMFYLIGYFATMIITAIYATAKKKINSGIQAVMLLGSVFINICVWLLEQFIDVEFEFLAISYIITELFLIGVYVTIQETEKRIAQAREELLTRTNEAYNDNTSCQFSQQVLDFYIHGLTELTQTEKMIYDLYIDGKSTQEVLVEMNIKENTLKYHNKNIYGKLGVTSRKELKNIAKYI